MLTKDDLQELQQKARRDFHDLSAYMDWMAGEWPNLPEDMKDLLLDRLVFKAEDCFGLFHRQSTAFKKCHIVQEIYGK